MTCHYLLDIFAKCKFTVPVFTCGSSFSFLSPSLQCVQPKFDHAMKCRRVVLRWGSNLPDVTGPFVRLQVVWFAVFAFASEHGVSPAAAKLASLRMNGKLRVFATELDVV